MGGHKQTWPDVFFVFRGPLAPLKATPLLCIQHVFLTMLLCTVFVSPSSCLFLPIPQLPIVATVNPSLPGYAFTLTQIAALRKR